MQTYDRRFLITDGTDLIQSVEITDDGEGNYYLVITMYQGTVYTSNAFSIGIESISNDEIDALFA